MNNQYLQNRTFFILPLFMLLILIGTFTIIPSLDKIIIRLESNM